MCSESTAPGALSRCSTVVSMALSEVFERLVYDEGPAPPPVAIESIWPSGPTTPLAPPPPAGPV